MAILEFENITKEYKRDRSVFNAVNSVTLSVEAGDFINITGRSGSGKSTLLNIGAGLLHPTNGNIKIDGQDIFKMNDNEISYLRNTKIGYVPQGQSLLSNYSVLNNICIPWYLFARDENPYDYAFSLLEKTGINSLASSYPKELSGGELKRTAIARALINKPSLLIADEPVSDLDLETAKEIMELFKCIASEGTAVIVVTHNQDLLNYGNKIYIMSKGNLARRSIK